jgi:ABC-type oligopeptide transport system substrate-binding subunit
VPTSSQAWNPSPLKTAELIQADMAQIGVKVIIVPVEGRFQEARLMDMSHDLTLSGWATDSNDPDSFFPSAFELRGDYLANQLCSLVSSRIRRGAAKGAHFAAAGLAH